MLRYENANGVRQPVLASGELTVENTTYCGAACVMCPRDEYKASRRWQHMSYDLFTKVMADGVELGITSLDLCGFGDPFMDPDFEAKLAHVRTAYPDLHVYTSSTAHLIDEKRVDWACKYLDTLKISNYGFSKESYEAIHGGVVKYEKVVENIERILARPRSQRPHVLMSYLFFPENEHEFEDWKAYWIDKADEVIAWRAHNYGGSTQGGERAYVSTARSTDAQARSCGRPFKGNPFVRANGDVSVCCFDFNHKLVVGNVTRDKLVDVLAGEQLADVQSIHDQLAFKGCGLLCEGCDQIHDRSDALVYSSNPNRKIDQPTTHPDHIVRLTERAPADGVG